MTTAANNRVAIRNLYCDESGFTGYNLLDPAQPIFAVASTDLSDEEALPILQDSFPRYQGAEFKFTNIWGSNNRRGLIRFAQHLLAAQDRVFVWMMDKRFAVLTKIVDFLIEPAITQAGYDFYDEGFAWKYCNYIDYGLKNFAPPELYEALVQGYQAFSRSPSQQTLAALQSRLRIMATSTEEPIQIFLQQMAFGAEHFERFNDLATFKGSDELQVTSMFATITTWRAKRTEDFAVIHDASSNFMRGREIWDIVTAAEVPEQWLRAGDGTMTEFPLRVASTAAMDSRDSPAIQFCDVLAGLACRALRQDNEPPVRQFLKTVSDAGFGELMFNGVRPSTVFPDRIPPKPLEGPDVVDQLGAIIRAGRQGRGSDPRS